MNTRGQQLWTASAGLLALALMVGLPCRSWAQDPAPGEAADAPEANELFLDEIVVTAQKREENLQEVPIQVTVFTETDIASAGIETPEDFVALTPNVTLGNSFTVGNSFVTIRGTTQVNNADPSIAIVVDGVYQASQKQLNQELFDIERIEMLKGPQGSIYGRNALGGALNIITRPPASGFSGSLAAEAGNGGLGRLTAVVNGSLTEKLHARLAAARKEADGWIDNAFLDRKVDFYEDTTVRGRLRFQPGESTSIDLRGQDSETEGGAVLYSLVPTTGGVDRYDIAPMENILGISERDVKDYSLVFTHNTDRISVVSISGYSEVTESYRGDLDFTNPVQAPGLQLGSGQDLDISYFSQEIRLSSTEGGKARWLLGGYYLETDRSLLTIPYLDTNGTIDGFIPLFFIGEENDNTASAFFAQTDFYPSAHWTINAGLRFDRDHRDQTDVINGGSRSRSFENWQPRLVLSYAVKENVLAYLSLARGFRSGGYNAPFIVPDFFREETTENLELGFKSTLRHNRIRLNGAAYHHKVKGFQFFQVDLPTSSQIISNINDVEMTGLELEILARVNRTWDVFAAVGLNDASIEDFDGSGAFTGNQTPNNVKSTFNAGLRFGLALGTRWAASGQVDAEYRGRQYWHPDNLDVSDARTFLNARLVFDGPRWSFAVWGKNLSDEPYWAEYFDAAWGGIPSGMDVAHLGRPRFFGVEASIRF